MHRLEKSQISLLPIVSIGGDGPVNCGNCVSACCKEGIIMPLSPKEAAYMIESGSEIELPTEVSPTFALSRKERREGVRLYQLQKACGNLLLSESGPGVCLAFDDPNRPAVCGKFDEGSFGCRSIRTAFGVTNTPEPVPIVELIPAG